MLARLKEQGGSVVTKKTAHRVGTAVAVERFSFRYDRTSRGNAEPFAR